MRRTADVTVGVLPIESSLSGPVAETHDLLFRSALSIVAETVIPVEHCLVAPDADPGLEVRTSRSHPEASPSAGSSARARRRAASRRRRPPTPRGKWPRGRPAEAAIASAEAAGSLYGLRVLVPEAGDRSGVHAVRRGEAVHELVRDGRPWRSALTFFTDHAPGALYRALGPIADGT